MESLIVGGSTLVDVDDHRRSSFAAENCLKELGELTLSEGNVAALHSGKKHTLLGFSNAKISTL